MGRVRTSIDTLRALGALFLLRILRPILIVAAAILVACYALIAVLALTVSHWWLLILLVLVPFTLVTAGAVYVLWMLLHRLLPRKLEAHERTKLRSFTDKALFVAETTRTPYPVILLLVAKDVLRNRESSFLRGLIGDSRTLMREFGEIQDIFRH